MSITAKIDGVTVSTKASVYFDGKCISHGIEFADGKRLVAAHARWLRDYFLEHVLPVITPQVIDPAQQSAHLAGRQVGAHFLSPWIVADHLLTQPPQLLDLVTGQGLATPPP